MNLPSPPFPNSRGNTSPLYAPVAPIADPLRIGLLVDGDHVPAWVARIVEQIGNSGFARIVVVVRNNERPRRLSLRARIRTRLRHFAWQQYYQRDSRRRRGPDSPFHARELRPLIGEVPWFEVRPKRRGFVHRIESADLERINATRPDLLLRFGFNILRGGILQLPRHGVWSYHHDDSAEYRGGPAMFWEIHEGNPLTGTVLQRLSEELDAGAVLYRSHAATHPHSLELNRAPAYWKASSFVMRCLRSLAAGEPLRETPPGRCDKPLYRTPGNLKMAHFLARTHLRKARRWVDDRLRVPHWHVAWRHTREPLDPGAPTLSNMRELPCPRGHFYADPMLHMHRDEPWLFVEDFDYRLGKGSLVALPWSDQGPAGDARPVLDLDVHLSYPFVFEWRGETWMVPESAAARRVSLYRARRFPDQWEYVCDLLHGHRAVDATLHEHNGRWYLFANICESGGGTYDELFLFHADTPLGPFMPHPCNPIVSDVRRARPAGRLFTHNGALIRPAQDCARGYGNALVFHRVEELDARHYHEQPLGRLAPEWAPGLDGCHTYARLGDIEVVDGKQPVWRRRVGA
ncbi:glucosamine inositolphosphorylceramide transferase family protein [Marilutibacter alkalisoli]|uniref:Glucosamine inositolphosphorylceramide transferase 1 N-terminal domain-containing protein n=1 Tax=Marilutibacter alkalisoli TaxID=2591633 RepID=A0A514BRU8_9GAMM|nr:hypothetical protein [Lysobacter alkalisoli]QDH69749.1 hypothetical protein FKV23_06305 [Lysobacter alkalisoli]